MTSKASPTCLRKCRSRFESQVTAQGRSDVHRVVKTTGFSYPTDVTNLVSRASRRARRIWNYRKIERAVSRKKGLEIGGPSDVFSPAFPNAYIPSIYALAASIDNCNFATDTVWSSGDQGRTFRYMAEAKPGMQYIHDATNLASIADNTYDFLLSSHVLEHIADPLRALTEFHRVLKPGGTMLTLVPQRALIFDRNRPFTTFEHLEGDFAAKRGEDDLTHLEEILTLHDAVMHPVGTPEEFRQRSVRNLENRCMHHHVFSMDVLERSLRMARFRPLYSSELWDHHLLLFAANR